MWLSPLQPNGNVSYTYSISDGVAVISRNTTALSAVVDNLRAFTNYTFTVTAMTSAGSSAPVMVTFMTLEGCELPCCWVYVSFVHYNINVSRSWLSEDC